MATTSTSTTTPRQPLGSCLSELLRPSTVPHTSRVAPSSSSPASSRPQPILVHDADVEAEAWGPPTRGSSADPGLLREAEPRDAALAGVCGHMRASPGPTAVACLSAVAYSAATSQKNVQPAVTLMHFLVLKFSEEITKASHSILLADDKQTKLFYGVFVKKFSESVASIIQSHPESGPQREGLPEEAADPSASLTSFLFSILPDLVSTLGLSFVFDQEKHPQPTRLSTALCDAIFSSLYVMALYSLQRINDNGAPYPGELLYDALHQLVSLHRGQRPLFEVALTSVMSQLELLNKDSTRRAQEAHSFVWTVVLTLSPYLISATMFCNRKNSEAEVQSIVADLSSNGPKFDMIQYSHLLHLSLLLGFSRKLSTSLRNAVSESLTAISLGFLSNSPPVACESLLLGLLNFSLPESESALEPSVPTLMSLLDSRDRASAGAISLLANIGLLHPSLIMNPLFSLLQGSTAARENALQVITILFKFRTAVSKPEDSQQAFQIFDTELAHRVIAHLSDSELFLRVQSAHILAEISPHLIVPMLLPLISHKDGNTRSAAAESLVSLLSHSRNLPAVITVILEELHGNTGLNSTSPPKTPAELLANPVSLVTSKTPTKTTASKDLVERVVSLTPKWAPSVDPTQWSPVANLIFRKFFACPSDENVLAVFRELVKFMGEDVHLEVVKQIIQRIRTQPKLNCELLETKEDEQKVVLTDLLFERLGPMVLLNVLPNVHFSIEKEVADICVECLTGMYEFLPVRRVAAGCCAKFKPVHTVPRLCMILNDAVSILVHGKTLSQALLPVDMHPEDVTSVTTVVIFALCNIIHSQGSALDFISDIVTPLLTLLGVTCGVPSLQITEPTSKLLQGCADCVATIISVQKAPELPLQHPIIEELTPCTPEHTQSIPTSTKPWAHTYPMSVIISTIPDRTRHYRSRLGAANVLCAVVNMSDRQVLPFLFQIFLDIIPAIQGETEYPVILASLLQGLFLSISRHVAANPNTIIPAFREIHGLCMHFLKESQASHLIHLGALKVLGSLLTSPVSCDEVFQDPSGQLLLHQTHQILSGIANMDPSSQVRDLAATLLKQGFGSP
ncbi:hypothetical protein Pelo_14012 [Pelomyxa schiedti]|nr:hypothetical protein Pelo_14012 [Pelomyxa schiedti]